MAYRYDPKYNHCQMKYRKEKVETLSVDLPKGEKAVWKAYAESKGTKVVTMIKEYMRGCIEADGFTVPEAEEAPEEVEEK